MRKSTGWRVDPYSGLVDTHVGWENSFSKLTEKDVVIRGSIYIRSKPI